MSTEPGSLFWLHALTPLRVGGDAGLGAINLPTMREQHTGHPFVPGSVIKGVLRAAMADPVGVLVRELFGPEREDASDHSGALTFSDARLVALPVRSLWGTFAWCTSRLCLRRLERDRRDLGVDEAPVALPDTDDVLVTPGSAMLSKGQLFIEEQAVPAKEEPALAKLAARLAEEIWPKDKASRDLFTARLVVLPDDALNALALIALEVRARVSLDPLTGTAAKSGPWLEESMPAETLLAGLAMGRDTKVLHKGATPTQDGTVVKADAALNQLREAGALTDVLTFGGHISVGYGRAMFRLVTA